MDKGKYSFLRPAGIETFAFIFSAGAFQWLHGTTTDDDGREIGNFTLFGDLLARMALADGTAKGFHRPAGTHRHLPFKGCIRDDISVPFAMEYKGWQRSFQPVHSQAKGKDKTALNGCKRADWLILGFFVVPLSTICLAIVCLFTGERKGGMAWSVSVELRDMPRYYRLRTVLPRHSRNTLSGCCPCRSQARTIPFVDTVSRLF